MSLMDTILRRKPVEAVAMIPLAEHEAVLAEKQIHIDNLADASAHNFDCWAASQADLRIERETVARLVKANRELRDQQSRRLAPLMAANAARKEAAAAKRKAKGGENGHG